jgi:hypothetical protein
MGTEWNGGQSWCVPGDVVGMAFNTVSGEIFFTKNGNYLGMGFRNVFSEYLNVS